MPIDDNKQQPVHRELARLDVQHISDKDIKHGDAALKLVGEERVALSAEDVRLDASS
jgi:hypothetical protein